MGLIEWWRKWRAFKEYQQSVFYESLHLGLQEEKLKLKYRKLQLRILKLEEKRFGGFIKPQIETNVVDLNDILPKDIWLQKNKKYLDGLSRLDVGG